MKIGIFAGTFDPIHLGHTGFTETAIHLADLDKVIVVAEKEPYKNQPFASWDHRQAMVERATEDLGGIDHDYKFAAELARQHTLKAMLAQARSHYGAENEFWLLVGSDIFEHFHKWHDVTAMRGHSGFIIALRDNHTESWLEERIKVSSGSSKEVPRHIIISTDQEHVSSSKIRSQVSAGKEVPDVPQNVAAYIQTHNLYS